MRGLLIIALASASICSSPALAQVGMGTTMPPLNATSPLGSDPGVPAGGTGIPMGPAASLSPVVSSLPNHSTGANVSACSTLGTPPASTYGSPSSYDGGGVTLNGTTSPATASAMTAATPGTGVVSGTSATSGLSMSSGMATTAGSPGMCGSGSNSIAASSAPTSTSTTRAGIPLDSTEIGNLGVSSWAGVPITNASPYAATAAPASAPTIPTASVPSTATVP